MKPKRLLLSLLPSLAFMLLTAAGVAAIAGYKLDWWTVDSGGGTSGSNGGSYSLSGSIGQPDAGTSTGGTYALNGGFWHPESETYSNNVSLYAGWNLVSFNLHPDDTSITTVLSSLGDQYSLVYAWDAATNAWRIHDPTLGELNDLKNLDEGLGFWIRMKSDQTLVVEGSLPVSTSIPLKIGWNLVGYPSAVPGTLPGVLRDHGLGSDFSLVYAYHANEGTSAWKLFNQAGNPLLNDLNELTPGWGYWIKASAEHTWVVP